MAMELFSCSGGLAAGFRAAGVDFSLAFDHDPNACDSYEKNMGYRPIHMDVRDLLRLAGAIWEPGLIDLLVADPPCAPWSRAGKRKGLADERDMLEVTVELIELLRPRAYLIGNIPGLQDATSWPTVQKLIGGLSKVGYCAADYACLDAADFGVPQRRVRPYWYGHLAGPCLVWPSRTHTSPRALRQVTGFGVEPLLPWVTCRDALSGLSVEDVGRLVRVKLPTRKLVREKRTAKGMRSSKRVPQSDRIGDPDSPLATITTRAGRLGGGDSAVLALHPRHPISQHNEPARGIGASDGAGAKGGKVLTWPWDRPGTTVCAGTPKIAAPGEHEGHNGPNAIVLSEKAAAILQGFPPGWVFSGPTKSARWTQIGQAVPVVVATAIARSVRRQMEETR